jgi:hypothetical protein
MDSGSLLALVCSGTNPSVVPRQRVHRGWQGHDGNQDRNGSRRQRVSHASMGYEPALTWKVVFMRPFMFFPACRRPSRERWYWLVRILSPRIEANFRLRAARLAVLAGQ